MTPLQATTVLTRIAERSRYEDRGHETPCHVFKGHRNSQGYGRIGVGSRTDGTATVVLVHRAAWEAAYGPVPPNLELDHLCRQTDCHRLSHLELVTHAENARRGWQHPSLARLAALGKRNAKGQFKRRS